MSDKVLVFISASYLIKFYDKLSQKALEDSIFFFGSKRLWLFPKDKKEEEESKRQPTKYLQFKKEFLDLILEKEKKGKVYFLKPDKLGDQFDFGDYTSVSKFFENVFGKGLILDEKWWLETFESSKSSFKVSGKSVVHNFKCGDHSYAPTLCLIEQSLPETLPILDEKGIPKEYFK